MWLICFHRGVSPEAVKEDSCNHMMKITVIHPNVAQENQDPVYVSVIIEGTEVLEDCGSVTNACLLLMGVIYAVNLSYPLKLKDRFEVFQKLFLELDILKMSAKVQSLHKKLLARVFQLFLLLSSTNNLYILCQWFQVLVSFIWALFVPIILRMSAKVQSLHKKLKAPVLIVLLSIHNFIYILCQFSDSDFKCCSVLHSSFCPEHPENVRKVATVNGQSWCMYSLLFCKLIRRKWTLHADFLNSMFFFTAKACYLIGWNFSLLNELLPIKAMRKWKLQSFGAWNSAKLMELQNWKGKVNCNTVFVCMLEYQS